MEKNELSPYELPVVKGDGLGEGIISPENMPVLHERLLENIVYFDTFCRSHGLTYCLMWGSLIGAVRNHGLIPWDDDMDVAMPRKDFEKLFELWGTEGDKDNFSLYRTTNDFCAKFPIGVLRNNNSTIIYDFCKDQDVKQGVKIDIEPWDEMPKGRLSQFLQYLHFRLYEVYSTQRLPNTAANLSKNRKLKIAIVKLLLDLVPDEGRRCKIACRELNKAIKYSKNGNGMVRCNASTKPQAKEDMFDVIDCDVAGHHLMIPKNYDKILRIYRSYGDYMEKPPVDKRCPNISYSFFDLNSRCEKYKGIYYCKHE